MLIPICSQARCGPTRSGRSSAGDGTYVPHVMGSGYASAAARSDVGLRGWSWPRRLVPYSQTAGARRSNPYPRKPRGRPHPAARYQRRRPSSGSPPVTVRTEIPRLRARSRRSAASSCSALARSCCRCRRQASFRASCRAFFRAALKLRSQGPHARAEPGVSFVTNTAASNARPHIACVGLSGSDRCAVGPRRPSAPSALSSRRAQPLVDRSAITRP